MLKHDSERAKVATGYFTRLNNAEYEQMASRKSMAAMSIMLAALITLPTVLTVHFT